MQLAPPRKPGRLKLPLSCLSAFVFLSIVNPIHALARPEPEQSRAAVFSVDPLPGFNPTLAQEIGDQVRAAGYAAEFINTTVLTNPALRLGNWSVLGSVTEVSPGQFQFTDPQATNSPRRFYRVRSP